jgi:NADH-quinone oxidoreductase subunit J
LAATLSNFALGPQKKYDIDFIQAESHTTALGQVLYTEYIFPFEVASLVLLVGLLGAIVLAKKHLNKS